MDPKTLDTELLIDRGSTMLVADAPGGKTRWDYARDQAAHLAAFTGRHAGQTLAILPFAANIRVYEGVTPQGITQIFQDNQPAGNRNLAGALQTRIEAHFGRRARAIERATSLLVMIGGAPDDRQAVANVITSTVKKMERANELTVSLMQVGQDPAATAFMGWLDAELAKQGSKFGIVDTTRIADVEGFAIEQLIGKALA